MIKIGDKVLTPYLNKWNLPSVAKVESISGDIYTVRTWNNQLASFKKNQILLEKEDVS